MSLEVLQLVTVASSIASLILFFKFYFPWEIEIVAYGQN